MPRSSPFKFAMAGAAALAALSAGAGLAHAYTQTDLVSDIPTLAALTDPSLKNPWGLSFFGPSPVWVSDQATGVSTLYAVTGSSSALTVSPVPLTVAIPPAGTGGPTGQVANTNTSSFDITGTGASALFIFGNLNGSISAWNGSAGTTAVVETTTSGASYTGLAINQANTMLYAANDKGAGSIDVFDSSFGPASGLPAGAFATPTAIATAGLVPFNVKDINGSVYVTYALSGHAAQTGAAEGEGAVAVFTEDGTLESMTIGGQLASPWGIALAPSGFGQFGGDLLVGNFSTADPVIDAFNPTNWAFEGSIAIDDGGEASGGLWSLAFGGMGNNGNPNALFFTDGINGEADGLFGAITVPEPSTWAMLLVGFGGLALLAVRRRRALPALG
jgi:uncharacterized protein (TIGR03118 family)